MAKIMYITKMKKIFALSLLLSSVLFAHNLNGQIVIYPISVSVGPYSMGQYYFYERNNEIFCTKFEVCNKLDLCETIYSKGEKIEEYAQLPNNWKNNIQPIIVKKTSYKKHACLTRKA